MEEHTIRRHEIRHHSGSEKEQNQHKNPEKFFQEVAGHLANAHEILLIGPGQAKIHFKEHVEKHNHELAKKLVGDRKVDHPTDGRDMSL